EIVNNGTTSSSCLIYATTPNLAHNLSKACVSDAGEPASGRRRSRPDATQEHDKIRLVRRIFPRPEKVVMPDEPPMETGFHRL
ncbi:TPA: hypothetical protein ACUNF5_007365, partial [Burkholderia orbicola]